MKRTPTLLAVGAFLYVLAWLLPIANGGTSLSDGGLPGWEVFRLALSPIWPYEGLAGDNWSSDSLSVLSALTNVGFLASVAILAFSRQRFRRWTFWFLVTATIVNSLWFVLSDQRSDLRIGYYLWLGSFIVLAVTARLVPAAPGSSTAPSTAA